VEYTAGVVGAGARRAAGDKQRRGSQEGVQGVGLDETRRDVVVAYAAEAKTELSDRRASLGAREDSGEELVSCNARELPYAGGTVRRARTIPLLVAEPASHDGRHGSAERSRCSPRCDRKALFEQAAKRDYVPQRNRNRLRPQRSRTREVVARLRPLSWWL
jgi:hypothetical protein